MMKILKDIGNWKNKSQILSCPSPRDKSRSNVTISYIYLISLCWATYLCVRKLSRFKLHAYILWSIAKYRLQTNSIIRNMTRRHYNVFPHTKTHKTRGQYDASINWQERNDIVPFILIITIRAKLSKIL